MSCRARPPTPFLKGRPMSRRPVDRAARTWPRCRLVLTLDRQSPLMPTVRVIMELTRYCREEATFRMWQAYHQGQSVLLTTHRERAELLAEQFAERGLHVTVENG